MTEINKEPTDDSPKDEPQLFEENHEVKKKAKGKKGKMILILVIAVVSFLIWPRADFKGDGVLQADKFARLGLTSSGVLKELLREKGSVLTKGELIARFENPELLKQHTQAELELGRLEDEKVIVNEKLKYLDKVRERTKMLYENGVTGKSELGKKEFDFIQATQEFVILEKKIQSAKRELDYIKEGMESLELKAPFDGVLLTDPSDTIGSPIQKGEFVLEIADPDTYFVEVLIPEEEVQKIKVGSKVKARFHAFSSKTYKGRVVRLAPRTSQEVEKVFKIRHVVSCEVKLDGIPGNFRYGMHASIKINS